jgi:hypothetical protein
VQHHTPICPLTRTPGLRCQTVTDFYTKPL